MDIPYPLISLITSPDRKPVQEENDVAGNDCTSVEEYASCCTTTTNINTKPRIIFITAPAITTIILFQTFALLNALGSGDSSSSPSIAQKPPIGKILSEYLVSPFPKEKIFGPIPSENSLTLIPLFLAVIKWPNS